MMDMDIKAKWVAALRSGQYNQIKGHLHSDSGFCCLGVLCDIVDASAWTKDKYKTIFGHAAGNISFPADSVLNFIGLGDGHIDHPFWELARMNDDGASFRDISDEIEKSL